jgi:glutamyl/glutaminyl-tRNA synthetase
VSNTPKHILLLEAMGFKPPQYGHLSLIHGPGGTPLSKRLEAVSIRQFRKQGYLPEAVANYLALLGWSAADNREIFRWEELKRNFTLTNVHKSASIFDSGKLDWVNGQHLRLLSDEDFAERAISYLKSGNLMAYEESLARQFLPVLKDNVERFDQLPDKLALLKDEISYENPLMLRSPESREVLQAAVAILSEVGAGTALDESDSYDGFVNALKEKVNVSGKKLFAPIRLALTGREHGPELKRIFPVLGMRRIRRRLERALEF